MSALVPRSALSRRLASPLFSLAFTVATVVGAPVYGQDKLQRPSHLVIDEGFPDWVVVDTEVIDEGRWPVAEDSESGTRLVVSIENGKLSGIVFLDKYGNEMSQIAGEQCPGGILGGVPMCLVDPSNPQDNPFICAAIPVDFDKCVCACSN